MAEDMRGAAKKYFTTAKSGFSVVKSYLKNRDLWSSDSLAARPLKHSSMDSQNSSHLKDGECPTYSDGHYPKTSPATRETVTLFPGWAVRRYHNNSCRFDLHVNVSGFATAQRSSQNATRAQRAFIRLARGFAALNKLAADHQHQRAPSTSGRSHPQVRHTDTKEEYSIEALDESFRNAHTDLVSGTNALLSVHESCQSELSDTLHRWQSNLESRVQLFWPTALSSRTVILDLFVSPHSKNVAHHVGNGCDQTHPVGSVKIVTQADGTFQHQFQISWEDLSRHPSAHCISQIQEHDLILNARLLPPPFSPPTSAFTPSYLDISSTESIPAKLQVTITHAPIRVISDIDDTVKLSNILHGARAIFRNVFVHDLEHTRIPGMGEWYTKMWQSGVRFHYVSNGPYQLLPVILHFFRVSQLPPGSIKLKSYAGRSLFSNLLTAPADRKRAGILDILESFPDSKFILIGDTGEQDLELYAQVAMKRPTQILAIFVRDVDTETDPIADPTGKQWRQHLLQQSRSDGSSSSSYSGHNEFPGNWNPPNNDNHSAGADCNTSHSVSVSNMTSRQSLTLSPITVATTAASKALQNTSNSSAGGSSFVSTPSSSISISPSPSYYTFESSTSSLSSTLISPSSPSLPFHGQSEQSPVSHRVYCMDTNATSCTSTITSMGPAVAVATPSIPAITAGNNTVDERFPRSRSPEFLTTFSCSPQPVQFSTSDGPLTGQVAPLSYSQPRVPPRALLPFPKRVTTVFTPTISVSSVASSSFSPVRRNTYSLPSNHPHTLHVTHASSLNLNLNIPSPFASLSSLSSSFIGLPSSVIQIRSPEQERNERRERKRVELQERVWRARAMVGDELVLRVFRDPGECKTEVEEILVVGGM